jgi:hypothetical protein
MDAGTSQPTTTPPPTTLPCPDCALDAGPIECPSIQDFCRSSCAGDTPPALGPHCAHPICDCTMEYPISRCDLPQDSGPCDGAFSRYFFDAATDSCELFSYGGCEGNENNFATKTACESFCLGKYSVEQACAQGTSLDAELTCSGVIAKDLCFAELIDACTCLECSDDCGVIDSTPEHAECMP